MKHSGKAKKKEKKEEERKSTSFLGLTEKDLDRLLPLLCVVLTLILFRKFVFSNEMLFGTDTIAAGVFFRSFYAHVVKTYHVFPLWDPYIFGGLPFVDAMHGDTFYPTAALKFFISIYRALGYKLIIHICIAGITAYYCARSFRISRFSSLFVGLTYMFSSNLVSLVYGGHGGKIYVIALFPLAVYLLNLALERRRTFDFILLGACIGLMILTAHVQMAYFALWGIGLYFLYRVYGMRREGAGALTGLVFRFLLSLGIGVSMAAVQLIPPYIYLHKYSPRAEGGRGYEFATSWSLHAEEVTSLVFPDFCGIDTGTKGTYWGRNPFKINHEYNGILPVLFAILAVCVKRRENLFWFCLSLLAIIYGLGADTPLFRIFYTLIPGVKVFRAPSLISFIVTFSFVIMAGNGLDYVREAGGEAQRRRMLRILFASLAVLFGFIVLVSAVPHSFFSWWTELLDTGIQQEKLTILQQYEGILVRGLWITGFFAAAGVGVLYLLRKSWSSSFPLLVIVLSLLSILDLWRVDSRFIQIIQPNTYFGEDSAVRFLEQQKGNFRVFPLPGTYPQNHLAFHGIEEVAGYHGNELMRYREFTGGDNLSRLRFLDLLNVRYIVTRSPIEHRLFKEVFHGDGVFVYENLDVLPRAFVVHCDEVITDDSRILQRLSEDSFDYRGCILLEENPGVDLRDEGITESSDKEEWVRIEDNAINSFTLECELKRPGFVFLSENYYPSWKAREGDTEIPVLRCDYTFRAISLPEGHHRIRFSFESVPMEAASTITLLTIAAVCVAALLQAGMGRRKQKGAP